jgi:hypothetical protein
MALNYDEELFQSFRAKAITSLDQLEIGKTYYSNTYPRSFTLKEFFKDDLDTWLVTEDGGKSSSSDRNIGTSYNPWLIFENEEDANACREQLVITHERDAWDDYWDDMDLYDDGYDWRSDEDPERDSV